MLEFKVIEQQLIRIDGFKPVADSVNYLVAKFDLSNSDFDGITTAIFEPLYDGDTYEQVLVDDTCLVPWEVIKPLGFDISLYCIVDNKRITTNPLTVRIIESGYKEGKTPSEPTPDVYSQILEKFSLANGKSAYEIAIENGYVGSVTEWLESLKGEKGEPFKYSDFTTEQLASLKGENYVLTDSDKQEIAAIVNDTVINVLETMIDESGVLV